MENHAPKSKKTLTSWVGSWGWVSWFPAGWHIGSSDSCFGSINIGFLEIYLCSSCTDSCLFPPVWYSEDLREGEKLPFLLLKHHRRQSLWESWRGGFHWAYPSSDFSASMIRPEENYINPRFFCLIYNLGKPLRQKIFLWRSCSPN